MLSNQNDHMLTSYNNFVYTLIFFVLVFQIS